MERLVGWAAWLVGAFRRAYAKKWTFFALFLFALFITLIVLAELDLLPNPPPEAAPADAAVNAGSAAIVESPAPPLKISIPAINLSAPIANPDTTNIEALDALLLKGAVRYPTSAMLGEDGNVVLFGHSSYLPVVGNQAYKTFNDIQKLKSGDTITLYSSQNAYVYEVKTVSRESANDAAIPLSVSGRVLTLATCNSFAKKTDRFVVTAEFVGSHVISP